MTTTASYVEVGFGPSVLERATGSRARRSRAVHLTRRGRGVLLLVMVALLLAAFSLGRAGSQAATPASPTLLQQTTVHAGDSLWSVARRIAPGADPRPVVLQLQHLNHVGGAGLRAGQQLLLPRPA